MNAQNLKQILVQEAAQAFPDDTNAWVTIQKKLANQQATKKPAAHSKLSPRSATLRVVLGISVALLILIAGFAILPDKQALANAWNHFFRITSADQFSTPSAADLASPTYAPTFAITLVPAVGIIATSTPVLTPTSIYQSTSDACGINSYVWDYSCWLASAEKKAGFTAKQLPSDLKYFAFLEIGIAIPGEIQINYQAIDGNGDLIFTQWSGDAFPTFRGAVPDNVIEDVQVGNNRGEYVTGDWASDSTSKKYVWNSCCTTTLRWMEEGRSYEIRLDSTESPYSNREALIQLATQLTFNSEPVTGPRPDDLTSLAEAAQLAPFTILSPAVLPDGFIYRYGSYDANLSQLKMTYALPGVEGLAGARILIVETPLDKVSLSPGENGEDLKGQSVDINGFAGIYFGNTSDQSFAVTWQTDEIRITLWINSNSSYGGIFTQDEILAIARSMK